LAEIASLEDKLANLRVCYSTYYIDIQIYIKANNKAREEKSKTLKKEYQDVKASNKRLTNAVKAASEGNTILKNTLDTVNSEFDGELATAKK